MAIPIIPRGDVPPSEVDMFFKFGCSPGAGGIPNPDPQPATFTFRRNLLVGYDLALADGGSIHMWIIEDPDAPDAPPPHPKDILRRSFPSPAIRVPQNALVVAEVGAQVAAHTIHWHGIEPTPMNDGVGHTSFELFGNYPYQFQPRDAGTYFYHCHFNTVLHFEMGLYGLLIVDPPDPLFPTVPVTYPVGGPGFAAMFNPLAIAPTDHAIHYDVEAVWVADSIDSRWHSLGHHAFLQNCVRTDPMNPSNFSQDGILNDFRPDFFVLTGIPRRINDVSPITAADNTLFGPLVAPTLHAGQTLLARVIDADYIVQRFTLGIDAQVIAMDGRALGVPPLQKYSHPFPLPAGTAFQLSSAMRWDLIIKPTTAGTYPVTIEYFSQISRKRLYVARTTITVI